MQLLVRVALLCSFYHDPLHASALTNVRNMATWTSLSSLKWIDDSAKGGLTQFFLTFCYDYESPWKLCSKFHMNSAHYPVAWFIQEIFALSFKLHGLYLVQFIHLERQNKYFLLWTLCSFNKSLFITNAKIQLKTQANIISSLLQQSFFLWSSVSPKQQFLNVGFIWRWFNNTCPKGGGQKKSFC